MEGKITLKQIEINRYDSKPKTLLMKKLNSSVPNKNLIKSEISQFFNSPEKFFNPESKIFVNKKINITKLIPIEDIRPSHNKTFGRRNSYRYSKNSSNKLSYYKEKNSILNKPSLDEKDGQSQEKKYELIDRERLKSIFLSFKTASQVLQKKNELSKGLEQNNKNDIEKKEDIDTSIPKQLSVDLSIQNRRLLSKKYSDKKSRETSKYLSRKLHKKENDLLINSVHLYRFKKEILGKEQSKDNYDKVNNQSCLFKWTSSLRRPKYFFGKRESYINVGGENNPLWSIIVERYPITNEVSVKSGYNLDNKDFKDFIRKRNNEPGSKAKIQKVENLDLIGIRGKKLYDLEYNREMSGNRSKILHKVFLDNGKAIMYKDVNDIFGHETIYKNYNGRNLYRNKKKIFPFGTQRNKNNNHISLKHAFSSGNIFN